MMTLSPGARFFLAQRKAQGISDVTDAQADALAALMVPVRVAGVHALGAGDTSPGPAAGADRGSLSKRGAA